MLRAGIEAENEARVTFDLDRLAEATELYERSCRAGKAHACYFFERLTYVRGSSVREFQWRETRFRAACEAGDARACFFWGQAFDDEGGRGIEAVRALKLYRKACAGGYEYACQRAAGLHVVLWSHPVSVVELRELTARSCRAGYGRACVVQANLVKAGRGGPRDVPRSRKLLAMACRRGQDDACVRLAKRHMYRVRKGIEPRASLKARAELEALSEPLAMACSRGHSTACMTAVGLAMEPLPVPQRDRARELLTAGCLEGGIPAACRRLTVADVDGELPSTAPAEEARAQRKKVRFALGEAMKREREQVRTQLTRRCDGGESVACQRLAMSSRAPGETAIARRKRLESLREKARALKTGELRFWFEYYRKRCFEERVLAACGQMVGRRASFSDLSGTDAVVNDAERVLRKLLQERTERRVKRFRKDCAAKEAFACYRLADELRRHGPDTPANRADAAVARAKAERYERKLRESFR